MVENTRWHVRSNGLNFIVMDQDCRVIAECKSEADARFIAAAPGLFQALKTILKRGYRIEVSDHETAVAAVEAARHE